MNKLLEFLFKKNKFLLIVTQSIIATVTTIIAMDTFISVIAQDTGIVLFTAFVFCGIFYILVLRETTHAKKEG